MARPFPTSSLMPEGDIEFLEKAPGVFHVYFTPPEEAVSSRRQDRTDYKRRIITIDTIAKKCTFSPYTVYSVNPMTLKYNKLKTVDIDFSNHTSVDSFVEDDLADFLSSILPSAFSEDFNYGLGFKKNYKPIVTMLEGFEIESLSIRSRESTSIDIETKHATISRSDLSQLVSAIDRVNSKAQRVAMAAKRDIVAELFFEQITNAPSRRNNKERNAELAKQIGLTSKFMPGGATKKEQNEAIDVIQKNGKRIMSERPDELVKLKNDIELVSLESLIERFSIMLKGDSPEQHWQRLFSVNPFILNLALGIPVIKVQEQASIGGMKLSGDGTKITDFLVRNSLSNNAAIVEIKTPGMKLLSAKTYRGGVHAPSNDLNAALSQVLDQIHLFQRDINQIKISSRQYEIESYAVHGVLIAGLSFKNPDEQKSLELFRGNSKNVQLITFDELLQKLKDLHQFLQPSETVAKSTETESQLQEDDLPF